MERMDINNVWNFVFYFGGFFITIQGVFNTRLGDKIDLW